MATPPSTAPERTSVFVPDEKVGAEYVKTAWATDDGLYDTGYFAIGDRNSILGDDVLSADEGGRFWRMIIADMSETHKEKYSHHNTLSDSVSVFATGAAPIEVNISGMLLLTEQENDCFEFLKEYVSMFRASALSKADKTMLFVCRDTTMKILLDSVAFTLNVENESYANVTFSGIAYRYKMVDSMEKPLFSYYGGTSGTYGGGSGFPREDESEQAGGEQEVTVQPPDFVGPPAPVGG